MIFADRVDAGRRLAAALARQRGPDLLVLGLPRGGLPVAFEVAAALEAPLDILGVRKIGLPGCPELAMGAVAAGGVRRLMPETIQSHRVPAEIVEAAVLREEDALRRLELALRGGLAPREVARRRALVIDDGLATGATMQAAAIALRRLDASRVIVAVPVGSRDACAQLKAYVDELVCLEAPEPFLSVGRWYQNFAEVSDDEAARLLRSSRRFVNPAS